jgi:hypothetical protein
MSNGAVPFTDTQSGLFSRRFYRLALPSGPPWFEDCRWATGCMAFDLVGEPGHMLVVEASTNLQDWTAIATNALDSVPLPFTDPHAAQFPQRFYRLLEP